MAFANVDKSPLSEMTRRHRVLPLCALKILKARTLRALSTNCANCAKCASSVDYHERETLSWAKILIAWVKVEVT